VAIIPAVLSLFLFFGLWIWHWLHTSDLSQQKNSVQVRMEPVVTSGEGAAPVINEHSSTAALIKFIILPPWLWLKKEQRQLYRIRSSIGAFKEEKPEKMLRLTQQSLSAFNSTTWSVLRREIALQPAGKIPLEKMEDVIVNAMNDMQATQDKTALLAAISKVLLYCAWSLNLEKPGSVADANIKRQMGMAYGRCTDLSSAHITYLESAFDCYHYALEIYQALHSDRECAITLCYIGDLYLKNLQSCIDQVSRLQLALHYYERAVQACSKDVSLDILAQTYYALSNAYYIAYEVIHDNHYLKSAYVIYKRTLAIYEQLRDQMVVSEIKDKMQKANNILSSVQNANQRAHVEPTRSV
jgi:tetratricopeptide (TPR) repeat protein